MRVSDVNTFISLTIYFASLLTSLFTFLISFENLSLKRLTYLDYKYTFSNINKDIVFTC